MDSEKNPAAAVQSSKVALRAALTPTGEFFLKSGLYDSQSGRTSRGQPRNLSVLSWHWMGAYIALSMALACLATLAIPPATALACGVAASLLAVLGGFFARLERREGTSPAIRIAMFVIGVVAPMFLHGMAMALWGYFGALDPYWGVTSIVCIGAIACAMLAGRVLPLAAAVMASWIPTAITIPSRTALTALGASALVAALITAYQLKWTRDAQNRRASQARINTRAEKFLRDYEETGQGWFWETDRRGKLTYVTAEISRALGRELDELIDRPFTDLFELGEGNREGERTLSFHLTARSGFQELVVRAASVDEERWWSINGSPVYDDFQNFVGFRGSGTDLTEKRRSQENETWLAHYDSLTGLANRFRMSKTLEKILNSPQERERDCAVMLIDLDRFKRVNDTMGHPVGDELLKQVGLRLERVVGETGRVGRIGGDEFELVVPGRQARERLGRLADDIIQSLSQPYTIDGQRASIGASIGIGLCPDDGKTSEALIRNADLALYAAKEAGRGRHRFYASDMHSSAEERSALEQDLRDAIVTGDLELFYQPVVATSDETISCFEALLRWNHPVKGWVSPGIFVPIAEDTGLINTIGEWALRTACAELANWPREVRCAVNVSPLQFANPALPSIVMSAIASAGINPNRLELEITESVFLNDDSGTDAMFASLKGIGVRLALDDFGTGYSSLGYLKSAPFDKIKIDQSFVRGATEEGSRNGALITSITSLAEALGMDSTAEGVETLDELELVRELGCSHVQGFIYEKALSSEAVRVRLEQGLAAFAEGPRSARPKRYRMLRKVVMSNGGEFYEVTIRNMSVTGALIEGLQGVPPGTAFEIALSDKFAVCATVRWSDGVNLGVEFAEPLASDAQGRISILHERPRKTALRAQAA